MDIIDIMLARALTPQGKTEAYVAKANKAAQKAAQAEQDAAAAIATVTAAAQDISDAQSAAAQLLETAQDALETAQAAQINTLDTEDVDAEINKLGISVNMTENSTANTYQVITTYPDNTVYTENATKMYKATGTAQDGTMTQKAITDALASERLYVDTAIAAIPQGGGSGSGNMNGDITAADAGHMVVVDKNGGITSSIVTEDALIESLLRSGAYEASNALGLDINYAERSFSRMQEAQGKSMGNDFNVYPMYGGRVRCNVNDSGEITAFYGDNNYAEDGSNGQVMVYQPKFYYKRIIRDAELAYKGRIVRHETLMISATEQQGFKLAPAFSGGLEYILLPAFDAGLVNDKLTSIAGVSPVNNITIQQAEAYANARGNGWHIMTMEAESANQMLQMIEYGTMNGQVAMEQGLTYSLNHSDSLFYVTGSTTALGNGSGHADTTTAIVDGNSTTTNADGYRAISYRGMENPWGNFWSMIGNISVKGTGVDGGGTVYLCKDFNYNYSDLGNNYDDVGLNLPSQDGWVNAMGIGKDEYDWLYIPVECGNGASSLLPIGDSMWTLSNLNHTVVLVIGGAYGFKEDCGPFYYGADRTLAESSRANYGAKLLFIPTRNSIYNANIAKWTTQMGE